MDVAAHAPVTIDQDPVDPTPLGAPTLRQSGRVLLFTAVYAAAFVGLVVAVVLVTPATPSAITLAIIVLSGAGAAAGAAVHVHLLRRDGLRPAALGLTRPGRGLAHLLWQVPLVIASSATVTMLVLGVLLQREPPAAGATEGLAASAAWPALIALLLVSAVVTPLWEEVLFRGLLFSSLTRSLPTIAAAIVSSAAFAAIHVIPEIMPYLFVLSLGSCWLYARHRTLWAPIALHAVNNALVATVAGVA